MNQLVVGANTTGLCAQDDVLGLRCIGMEVWRGLRSGGFVGFCCGPFYALALILGGITFALVQAVVTDKSVGEMNGDLETAIGIIIIGSVLGLVYGAVAGLVVGLSLLVGRISGLVKTTVRVRIVACTAVGVMFGAVAWFTPRDWSDGLSIYILFFGIPLLLGVGLAWRYGPHIAGLEAQEGPVRSLARIIDAEMGRIDQRDRGSEV